MNRVDTAKQYFKEKYHCSQAVFAAFAVELGLTEAQALKIGGCFGAGMCKGEVCGAVTGALMALGLKYGQCTVSDLNSRIETSAVTVEFMERFQKENGSYICRELLGFDLSKPEEQAQAKERGLFTSFCPRMVESATRIAMDIMVE